MVVLAALGACGRGQPADVVVPDAPPSPELAATAPAAAPAPPPVAVTADSAWVHALGNAGKGSGPAAATPSPLVMQPWEGVVPSAVDAIVTADGIVTAWIVDGVVHRRVADGEAVAIGPARGLDLVEDGSLVLTSPDGTVDWIDPSGQRTPVEGVVVPGVARGSVRDDLRLVAWVTERGMVRVARDGKPVPDSGLAARTLDLCVSTRDLVGVLREDPTEGIVFHRSFDQGQTWEPPVAMDPEGTQPVMPCNAAEKFGAAWLHGGNIVLANSRDRGRRFAWQSNASRGVPAVALDLDLLDDGTAALAFVATDGTVSVLRQRLP